jgi:hypothetical protein
MPINEEILKRLQDSDAYNTDRIRNLENEMLLIRSGEIAKHGVATKEDTAIKVKIGYFTCPASTGNYSVTGVGFKPRYVEFIVGIMGERTTDIYYSLGWMDYNGNQGAIGFGISGAATTLFHSNMGAGVITIPIPGDTFYVGATYVSMNNDGFTINFNTVNTSFGIYWKVVR